MRFPLLLALLLGSVVGVPARAQAGYSGTIEARNLGPLRTLLRQGPVEGLAVGNSIMAGGWVQLLTTSVPNLRVTNAAVGGAQASQMGFVVAPVLPGDATGLRSAAPNPALAGKRFALVGGARNEADAYAYPDRLNAERVVYEGVIDSLLASGVEPIVLSDPPQIDMASGAIYPLSAVADPVLVGLQRDVARAKGVTFVNVWAQFMAMKAAGQDLRPLYIDGTHPEAPGRLIIANMVASALNSEPNVAAPRGAPSATALAVAYPVGGAWKPTPYTMTAPLSTLLARGRNEVYALNAGESASVAIPTASQAWVDTVLQPRCGGVKLNWNYGTQQYLQAACSSIDSSVHREQTDALGPVPGGRLTVRNTSDRLMEIIGVLLGIPR